METRCLNLSIWNVCHLIDKLQELALDLSVHYFLCFLTTSWVKLLLLYQFLKWGKWVTEKLFLPKDVYLGEDYRIKRDISCQKFTMTSTIPIWKIILWRIFALRELVSKSSYTFLMSRDVCVFCCSRREPHGVRTTCGIKKEKGPPGSNHPNFLHSL